MVATDCGDMLTISHRFSVMHARRSWRARLRDVKVFKMSPHLCQNAAQATSCADYRRSENTAEPSGHKKVCHLFPRTKLRRRWHLKAKFCWRLQV